jgi:hypothetical protein
MNVKKHNGMGTGAEAQFGDTSYRAPSLDVAIRIPKAIRRHSANGALFIVVP